MKTLVVNTNRKTTLIITVISFFVWLHIFDYNPFPAIILTFFTFFFSTTVFAKLKKKVRKKYAFLAEENNFSNSLLYLVAAVIKIDGKKTDSEFRYIEIALLQHYPLERTQRMMAYIKGAINHEGRDHTPICRMIILEFDAPSKIQLMHLLIGVATADGLLTKNEEAFLKDIGHKIKVPYRTYMSIINMFHFRHEGAQYQQKKKSNSSTLRFAQAYNILEITEDATVDQIKKAYRKLALKHHPDRVIHLGEEYQKVAHEKFQTISDAYEYIKDRKGFS